MSYEWLSYAEFCLFLPVVEAFEEVFVGKEDVDVWQGELDGAERCARSLVFVLQHVVT